MFENEKELPLVSVVILSYNNLIYIKDCIDSILEQEYPKIELIISDDASRDFNAVFLKEYIDCHKKENIKAVYIHTMKQNGGTSKNFNYALSYANGKYVKFIAADDLFSTLKSLSILVTTAEKSNANVVIARADNYDQYLERYEWTYPNDEHWKLLSNADYNEFFGLMSEYCLISAPSVLFDRDFLVKYNGADEKYPLIEDWPLWMKMLRNKDAFTFLDKKVVIYRSGGVSNGKNNEAYARHQIEYADVIRNEALPYADYMASRHQVRRAKRSERLHRLNGMKLFEKNKSIIYKIKLYIEYSDVFLLKIVEKINRIFWNLQNHKRKIIFYSFILLTLFMVSDFSSYFSMIFSPNLAFYIGEIITFGGTIVGFAGLLIGAILYAIAMPVKLFYTIKYLEK